MSKKIIFFRQCFSENFQSNDDNMKRYSPAMKEKILGTVERLALKHNIKKIANISVYGVKENTCLKPF